MKAEFEEKDFEAPLYNELRFGSHRIATPGQVFEGKFGIDAALEAEHPLFWDLFGFYDVPQGVILDDLRWGFVWRKLGRKRRLPTFNINLLIQAKRPETLKRASPLLKNYGFSSQYWRFEITEHQQEILEKVSYKLRRKALVIYASPAFHTLDDLYDHTEAQTVVENSSFVKVERLHNHKQWSYYQPGTSGVAHSEPEFIEDVSLYSMIEQAGEFGEENENVSENLHFLYKMTVEACQEIQEHNPIAKYYLRLHGRLMRLDGSYELEETFHYVAFSLFCNVTKLKWLTV
ncbi:MAG: hypothetical protein U0998_09135 [Moraxellaceae bacterium]|nr:hypothetical protein [Erysipelotrichaceae bacterium]MDZ4298488.1 hypothetical protein [Moraxellaceae bacterium]MDZ4387345.1 hypothetical protein [Moraxellaceae bacterium]